MDGGEKGALSHYRRHRKRGLVRKLQAAGIEVAYASYFNCLLFPIAAAHRLIGRVRAEGAQEPAIPPPWMNRIQQFAFGLEAGLVGRIRLPIGLSVVAIGRKAASGLGLPDQRVKPNNDRLSLGG